MAKKTEGAAATAGGATGPGLRIYCHGEFYYKTQNEKGVKPFEKIVMAPSLEVFRETSYKYTGQDEKGKHQYKETSFVNVRGQLKRRLLPILLARDFRDFARVRFVVIDEIVSLDGSELDLPIQLRSRDQLVMMLERERIPIDAGDYIDIDELRSDILEYVTDPAMFLASKPRRDKRREQDRLFAAMNNIDAKSVRPEKPKKSPTTAQGIESL